MASEKTITSRYESLYGGGFVTSAQILAEAMCARMARFKKSSLPAKFWNLPDWNKTFLWQLRVANTILKEFHEMVIARVLRSKDGKFFLSLTNKKMLPLLTVEQSKYELEIKRICEQERVEIQSSLVVKPALVTKRSFIDIMKEVDSE